MKVLFITNQEEDFNIVKNIVYSKFSKVEMIHVFDVAGAMDQAATNGPFLAFIIDADMKELDPNEIGQNLIEFTGPRPILFFGTEALITQRITDALFESHSLNDTILRPTSRDSFNVDVINKFQKAIEWMTDQLRESAIEEVNPNDFIPMKIKSFFLYRKFPHDIYLMITTKSFMRIISANRPYTHNMLSNYAQKNIKYLFIKKDDQLKFLEDECKKCLQGLVATEPTHKDIYLILLRSVTILHQYMLALGITHSVYKLSDKIIEVCIEHFRQKGDFSKILKGYPKFYTGIASKSLLTAFVANAIAAQMGWDSTTTMQKLIMCALLQDISLPDDTMSSINSLEDHEVKLMHPKVQEEYAQHPIRSAQFSKQFSNFSDIDYIIEMHHELPNRKGFPAQPPPMKLTKICAIFNTSQYLAAELDRDDNHSADRLQKIFKAMQVDFNHGSFKEILRALKPVLKL